MELREYQKESINKIKELQIGDKAVISLPTGCHAKGTKILMYDGTYKNVENIKENDLVMGIDSTPRKVLKLHTGIDDMYKIIQNKGENFIVNKEHILSLIKTNERSKESNRVYSSTKGGSIKNISVNDYLLQSNYFKHLHKLYKSDGVDFEKNDLNLEPYLLGLLLGDGSIKHNKIMITTMDSEIENYIYKLSNKYNLKVRREEMENNKSCNYHIITNEGKKCKRNSHYIKEELKKLDLFETTCDNKFIPYEYKTSSRENRLQLLAGLIDTDGTLQKDKCSYEIVTKSKLLNNDILFIARSLGFYCNSKIKIINNVEYYRIYINGNCNEIPVKIKRKVANKRISKVNHLVSGFKVEYIGKDNYYGFTLDGDNLYMLEDFTITHNCGKTIVMSGLAKETPERILIVVMSTELREQTIDKLKFVCGENVDVGSVQGKLNECNNQIIVATRQSLTHVKSNRLNDITVSGDFKYIIFDECHVAVEQIQKIIDAIGQNSIIVGVTATPYNQLMTKVFDNIIYEMTLLKAIKSGYLVEPKAKKVYTNTDISNVKTIGGEFVQKHLEEALNNDDRNNIIVKSYLDYAQDRKHTIVFASGIDHANAITQCFNDNGIDARSIDSTIDSKERSQTLEDFKAGKFKVLVNVSILTTGFDFTALDCVIMARSTKSRILYMQCLGRVLRLAEGKENALEKLRLEAEEIELFNSNIKNIYEYSNLDWFEWYYNNNLYFVLSLNDKTDIVLTKVSDEFISYKYEDKQLIEYERNENLKELVDNIDNMAYTYGSSFINKNAKWKREAPTEKQIACIKGKWKVYSKFDCHKYFKSRSLFFSFKNQAC